MNKRTGKSCPLMMADGKSPIASECIGRCAWFKDGQCVMVVIADVLTGHDWASDEILS
jgi:hypothetical protein